jgi:uncharacterized membrane protein YraQ (UPF0718 family)
MTFLDTIGKGLKLAGEMAWATWWALILGFTIAGAVEAFVSKEKMGRVLGGRGLRTVGLGTLFGAASSSCSFGAVATAKSLFKKGASPEASLGAFQFASTNLVIELGLVMWVLLGWQFVAANFLSGLILIALLVAAFRWIVPDRWFEQGREHVKKNEGVRDPNCGMEVDPEADGTVELETKSGPLYFCSDSCRNAYEKNQEAMTIRERLTSRKGWSIAFGNAVGEWAMLWKDIAAGFVIAGLIAAFIPRTWWTALFGLGPEGSFAQAALSAFIGVVVGVVTFVCSVGNVPFALILWKNGIPFGAVMSFIFADLIVPTITDAYRRYYGWRLAAVLFGTIFVCAVVSGIAIHYIWHAFGLVPPKGQLGGVAPSGYALYLNIIFTILFVVQLFVRFNKSAEGQEEMGGQHQHSN